VRERHDGLYRVSTYLAAKMIDGALTLRGSPSLALHVCARAMLTWRAASSQLLALCAPPDLSLIARFRIPPPSVSAEIGVAALGSVVISAIVYYGVRLEGAFTVFWITYFATLCVGICEDVYQNTLRNMYSQKNRFAIAAEP
jgi:hypothetical protein